MQNKVFMQLNNKMLLNKFTQLTLHAGLGALSNKLTGNDALSGAISGVSGEIFAELLGNSLYKTTSGNELTEDQRNILIQYGGLAGGLSALINGKLTNQSNNEIANNMFAGQRLGSNAVENNLLYSESVQNIKKENLQNNFGPRWIDPKTGNVSKEPKDGYKKRTSGHNGTDISAPEGEQIYSIADGKVVKNYASDSYGNTIIVETITPNGEKVWTLYAHMNKLPDIPVGTIVQEGQPIGNVGNTGASKGNHLHLGISSGENGNTNYYKNWINPEDHNIGNYEYLKDTPYQQNLKLNLK